MPVVYTAITPHPPVLIPEIGKDNVNKLKKTAAAMKQIEQDLYAAKIDSLVVISTQEKVSPDSFTINLSADYRADFKDFGDFGLELKFKSDFMSIQEIRARDEGNDQVAIALNSEERLEHGFSVPLYFFMQHLKNVPIIPIAYSGLSYQEHFKFGTFLYDQLASINKRFAVLASADLSHRLTKDAPAGFSAKGKEFDKQLLALLKKKDWQGVINMDPELIKEAAESGLRSIIILLGMLEQLNVEPELLSYEGPFGVGYAVMRLPMA